MTKRMGKDFGAVTRTKTWRDPIKWNARAPELQGKLGRRVRVFCASLTDFFIQDADQWRDEAWNGDPRMRQSRLPDPDQAPTADPVAAASGLGHRLPERVAGHDVRRALRPIRASTTCARCPPPCASFPPNRCLESLHDIDLAGIHWLIAGGESGSGFRPMKDEWALELRDRCREQGVAFHFKQHSAFRPGTDPLLGGVKYHESPLVQIEIGTAHRRLLRAEVRP